MGVKITIDCPNCAGKVYVLSELPPMEVTCSTCLAVWIWPSETHPDRKKPINKVRLEVFGAVCFVFLFLLGIGLLIYPMRYFQPERGQLARSKPANPPNENRGKEKIDLPPELPLPENGHGVFNFDKVAATSGLEISPDVRVENLLVKVVRANDSQLVCTFLILRGQTFNTPIPNGDYRIRLASGAKWYGDKHTFGPHGIYSEIAQTITIREGITERIGLTPKILGQLTQRRIDTSDF